MSRPKFEMTVQEFIREQRHPDDKPIIVRPRLPKGKDQAAEVRLRIKELLKERQ